MGQVSVAPVIGLKSVQYAAFASQETACFEAIVLVDGAPFCRVSNEGHGGADFFEPLRGSRVDLADAIFALAKRINPEAYANYRDAPKFKELTAEEWDKAFEGDWWTRGPHSAETILSALVGRALDAHLIEKKTKRDLKSRLIVSTKSGKVLAYKLKGFDVPRAASAVRAQCARDGDPVETVLNEVPLAQAVEIIQRAAV